MKLFLNRKPLRDTPWGGGNLFVQALCDYLPNHDIQVTHELAPDIDVIFLQDPRPDQHVRFGIHEAMTYRSVINPNVKIIHRINECDARKGTKGIDDMLHMCSGQTDRTVFVSEWMQDYFVTQKTHKWQSKNVHVVYNGVNKEHFKEREKLDNGKINIVAHHWSDNRMKGANLYEYLDTFVGANPEFTFTYIGRHACDFKNATVIEPLHGHALGTELSRYSVYLTGTSWDPGPNHVLESVACSIPTYALSQGGGANVFVDENHVIKRTNDFSEVEKILLSKKFTKNRLVVDTWEECVGKYAKIIKSMCNV
jgi:hypothetical protein